MNVLKFLQTLVARGGDPREVRITAPNWSGAWKEGVYLREVDDETITVSSSMFTGLIRLVTSHPVFDLEVGECHRMFGTDYIRTNQGKSLVSRSKTYTILRLRDPVDRSRI